MLCSCFDGLLQPFRAWTPETNQSPAKVFEFTFCHNVVRCYCLLEMFFFILVYKHFTIFLLQSQLFALVEYKYLVCFFITIMILIIVHCTYTVKSVSYTHLTLPTNREV